MNDELQKWQQRFESQNGRQPNENEFETAQKRITRNVQAQRLRQTRSSSANKNIEHQINPQSSENKNQPPVNNRWSWLIPVGLAVLIIVGGIIAFKIGSAHGTTLF